MLLMIFGPMDASRSFNLGTSWEKIYPESVNVALGKLQAGKVPCGVKVSYALFV
jgi:hypothetical protein